MSCCVGQASLGVHLTVCVVCCVNNVILARNRQLPDDDRMIETCRSIFKSFNVNNLSVHWLVYRSGDCEVHGATIKKNKILMISRCTYDTK